MLKRHNPKYDNICWWRKGKCDGCSKKEECDETQIWWQQSTEPLFTKSKTPSGQHVKSKKNDGKLTNGEKSYKSYLLNKYGNTPS